MKECDLIMLRHSQWLTNLAVLVSWTTLSQRNLRQVVPAWRVVWVVRFHVSLGTVEAEEVGAGHCFVEGVRSAHVCLAVHS